MCNKIVAVVVTFNRKFELVRCIEAIRRQTTEISDIIIVNNASTDGTIEYLREKGYICDGSKMESDALNHVSAEKNTSIWIYNGSTNTGGSGGFYIGLKSAKEQLNADYVWMMDDDGYPSDGCLEMQMNYIDAYDYVMPVSIDIEKRENLSWAVRKTDKQKTIVYEELKESWGRTCKEVTPFNGVLLSRRCIDEVGYIKKELFIWGDEYEHYWRCREKGYEPITVIDAIFYHPSQKLPLVPIMRGIIKVPYVESEVRMICLARNYTYIYRKYHQQYKIPLKFFMYTWLFLITRKGDFKGWKLYCNSVADGFREDFTRHLKYLM